jgi:hypothetical protein
MQWLLTKDEKAKEALFRIHDRERQNLRVTIRVAAIIFPIAALGFLFLGGFPPTISQYVS